LKTYRDIFHIVNYGIIGQVIMLTADSLWHSKNRLGFFPEWIPMIHCLITCIFLIQIKEYYITKSNIFDEYLGLTIIIYGINFSLVC
jgi:hypothetical protein